MRKVPTQSAGKPSPDEHLHRVVVRRQPHVRGRTYCCRHVVATCPPPSSEPFVRRQRRGRVGGRSWWVRIGATWAATTAAFLLLPVLDSQELLTTLAFNPAAAGSGFHQVCPIGIGSRRSSQGQKQGLGRLLVTAIMMSRSTSSSSSTSSSLDPNFDSNDPYEVLGMANNPTSDQQQIKRAYKKLALQFHPDVSNDPDKKRASDRFAKINWAYQTLSGKLQDQSSTTSSSASTKSSTSSSWTPPHRRPASSTAGSTSRRSGSASTDWRDYMPRYDDDEQYDTGGDSLGAIFRDLVAGAATGGRGVLKDFVEFLEQNVDGYGVSSSLDGNDAELKVLLRTGSLGEIGDEMDTTELVVKQLTEKLRQLDEELVLLTAEAKIATKYLEKLQLDERSEEVKARKKVVEGYIGKARKRLLALQSRYKEMVVAGDNDPKAGGRNVGWSSSGAATGSSWSGRRDTSSSYQTSSSTATSAADYAAASPRPRHDKPEDKWKDDSFGSFGRGRGSSRRQRASNPESTTSSRSTAYSSGPSASSRDPPTASSGPYRSASGTAGRATNDGVISPHKVGPYSYDEDKRRMRDLKVDEEFDKLKRDLGL